MTKEYNEMKERFDKYSTEASWNNQGDLGLAENFVEIRDLTMEKADDVEKGTILQFVIHCSGTNYGLHVQSASQLVFLLKDGRSVSGTIKSFTSQFVYVHLGMSGSVSAEYQMPALLINGIAPDEIEYIKMTDTVITKLPETFLKAQVGFEFTVYRSDEP